MEKVKIGVIGCGMISEMYIKNMTYLFLNTEVWAVSDIKYENAKKIGEQFYIPNICKDNEELLAMEEIEIIVILTIPSQHYQNCKQALLAGKHVHIEKPLSLNCEEGKELVALAKEKDLKLSCAPDTILGAGIQTSRKLIEEGWIGKPFGAICQTLIGGHESWHPNPEFFYKEGAGPLLDVGPYYISAMTYLLGEVESVMSYNGAAFEERTITSELHYGEKIKVEVPTYVQGQMRFKDGTLASIINSFDVKHTKQLNHTIEIYGTEGTLVVPSPCYFDGEVLYRKNDMEEWSKIPTLFCYKEDSRGLGVSDLAAAIKEERRNRLTADMAYHSLEVMNAFYESAEKGKRCAIESSFEITQPMSLQLKTGEID